MKDQYATLALKRESEHRMNVLMPFRTKKKAMMMARKATRYLDGLGNCTIIMIVRIDGQWFADVPEHIARADKYQGIFDLLTEVR